MSFGDIVSAVFLGDFLFCFVLGLLKDTKEDKEKELKKTCGNCICYLNDTDENGNVTNYHHDRNKPTGFCAIQPLFTERKQDDKICSDYAYDKED